jgi:hypothetical protein
VVLAPGVIVADNPRDDPASKLRGDFSHVISACEGARVYLTAGEASALRLFTTPQVLGEALFARPKVEALEDARRLLAECLRRGLLVEGSG